MKKITISLIAIYILNIIDYVQTIYAIKFFGLVVEANPIARFLFEHNCAWIPKIIVLPILLTALGVIVRAEKKLIWTLYFLNFLIGYYLIFVIHNFYVLWQLGLL